MQVFVNSASFVGQARDLHHGGQLITQMMQVIEQLVEIGLPPSEIYRDDELRDKPVAGEVSLSKVFAYRLREIQVSTHPPTDPPERERFTLFLNRITRQPFAQRVFGDHEFTYIYNGNDISLHAPGYAAHFTYVPFEGTGASAAIVGLPECPEFAGTKITVMYKQRDSPEEPKEREVWNVTQPGDVEDVKRTYDPHGKHDPTAIASAIGMTGSRMDLPRETAQVVLNQAVALPGERRLFARYEGRIYIFPCHDATNQQYHGYRVEINEFKRRQADICTQIWQHFKWSELR